MTRPQFHVGIVGAGLGGLAAAIAIARAGDRVTVLEQAAVLGEVGTYYTQQTRLFLRFSLSRPTQQLNITLSDRSWHPNPPKFFSHSQEVGFIRPD
jgi:2-polyprenyl-6-methoxyphenol hydroxylase-like FAD-dependent oxidoreductase